MDGDVDTEKVAAVLEVIQSYGNKNKDGSSTIKEEPGPAPRMTPAASC